ncbi:hypothetical protein CYLTODRAFT_184795 [Cylindrobasidium torrendii FP15055 ss-10]|uniref:Uncharacterized protein n=1 Tax=Cylindrobasidium torrendii FP15055 ss-10 TaxID=1314674 RepID=A0A0D7BIS4_9AGAR|nr:hypothetical protein CYLTODRAFT_184795 [Cylindrobasidium torrendii FP15055 ss-10]
MKQHRNSGYRLGAVPSNFDEKNGMGKVELVGCRRVTSLSASPEGYELVTGPDTVLSGRGMKYGASVAGLWLTIMSVRRRVPL